LDAANAATQLQDCVIDVADWSGAQLLLNPTKTEVVWFVNPYIRQKYHCRQGH